MFRLILPIMVLAIGIVGCGAFENVTFPDAADSAEPDGFDGVPAPGATESLHAASITGLVHDGCRGFRDSEDVVSQGTITWVKVCHGGGFVNGLQLGYGDHEGSFMGFQGWRLAVTKWSVPAGERIRRVEVDIAGHYVSRLQFTTDKGSKSPVFGGGRGQRFDVGDPSGLPLRTISLWANLKRDPSFNRAVTSMTFTFGEP